MQYVSVERAGARGQDVRETAGETPALRWRVFVLRFLLLLVGLEDPAVEVAVLMLTLPPGAPMGVRKREASESMRCCGV